jgi:hypothetical protein
MGGGAGLEVMLFNLDRMSFCQHYLGRRGRSTSEMMLTRPGRPISLPAKSAGAPVDTAEIDETWFLSRNA